nr:hypothetical protein [Tanacetum cinerariifolium]
YKDKLVDCVDNGRWSSPNYIVGRFREILDVPVYVLTKLVNKILWYNKKYEVVNFSVKEACSDLRVDIPDVLWMFGYKLCTSVESLNTGQFAYVCVWDNCVHKDIGFSYGLDYDLYRDAMEFEVRNWSRSFVFVIYDVGMSFKTGSSFCKIFCSLVCVKLSTQDYKKVQISVVLFSPLLRMFGYKLCTSIERLNTEMQWSLKSKTGLEALFL